MSDKTEDAKRQPLDHRFSDPNGNAPTTFEIRKRK
jgi:hypothetical protein